MCQDETFDESVLWRISANMPRVRWSMLVLCILLNFVWIVTVTSDCWFENQKHAEGDEVVTAEPCLNCTCKQGALVCYLRVCTKLPDPPPPGCIILHRRKSCCPELVCRDVSVRNRIDARSEPQESTKKSTTHCVANGTIYGTGSAMSSSSFCEHCFCIEGRQTCIRPKCLLNLEGCAPVFEDHNCCPTRYNCSGHSNYLTSSSTTTTQLPRDLIAPGGCMVSGDYYSDGSKVLGMGHSVCDNCYCLRGMLRCEPLSCAPPILGCQPVIKSGECCASSYNCNGTIEIQPEPYYGSYPTISKDYAKFRKEVQQQKPSNNKYVKHQPTSGNFNNTFYVMAESTQNQRQPDSVGTTRHIFSPSTKEPYFHDSKNSAIDYKFKTKDTTNSNFMLAVRTRPSTNFRKSPASNKIDQDEKEKAPNTMVYFTTKIPKFIDEINTAEQSTPKQLRSADYEEGIGDDVFLSFVDSLFDNKINESDTTTTQGVKSTEPTTEKIYRDREIVATTPISDVVKTSEEETPYFTDVLSTLLSSFTDDVFSTTLNTDLNNNSITYVPPPADNEDATTESELTETTVLDTTVERKTFAPLTMVTTLVTTTDCSNSSNSTLENRNDQQTSLDLDDEVVVTTVSTEVEKTTLMITTTEEDVTVVDLESKVKVDDAAALPNKTSKIETILNMTLNKNKDYEDYDYNEPTLPPSLPNLRIIPFVAADALDAKKEDVENLVYPLPLERVAESPPYSLFSPPSKTEGGFVPKEPPIMLDYYGSIYHTTKIVDITSTTPSPLTDLLITQKSGQRNCIADNREYQHSDTVTAKDCVICTCFYGNIVCQKLECPIPSPGCRQIEMSSKSCCPEIICDEGAHPTLSDRIDVTSNPENLVTISRRLSTEPFKTKRITNSNSLVDDSKPYFSHSTAKISSTKQSTEALVATTTEEFSFNKMWDMLFYGDGPAEKLKNNTAALIMENKRDEETTTVGLSPMTTSTETSSVKLKEPPAGNGSADSAVGVGLLKLAGCNIYGRMYRVGRIISELSGPCLECKCTEVGVQCVPLKCLL